MKEKRNGYEKRAAQDVRALLGCNYMQALEKVRAWTAAGLRWDEEIPKLAAELNRREDA